MGFCLPKFAADTLREKFRSGEIRPDKLMLLDSAGRRSALSFLGPENAKRVNAEFESALLRKNQKEALVKWAHKVLGDNPTLLNDALAKVERNRDVMSRAELDMFLEDYIERRLGFRVSEAEAGALMDLSRQVAVEKARLPVEMPKEEGLTREYLKEEALHPEWKERRIRYGLAVDNFNEMVAELKTRKVDIERSTLNKMAEVSAETLDTSKSLVSSMDDSVWGNQAITYLLDVRYADIWVKNLLKSYGDIKNSLLGRNPISAVRADILSRPDAVNGLYRREGVAIGIKEEAFPTSLPEKMSKTPVIGPILKPLEKLYRASSDAYHAGLLRMRVDVVDRMNYAARKAGVDLSDKANAEAIGNLVNSGTGRGSLGSGEPALKFWNRTFFSPRMMRGTFDVLTAHLLDKKVRSNPYALKLAAQRLMAMTATYVGVMSVIEALNPGSTELDPRGLHFGEVRIGKDRWLNVIGPYRPMVRAAARLLPTYNSDVAAKKGFAAGWGFWWKREPGSKLQGRSLFEKKPPKYGEYTALDVAEDFFQNKTSPVLSSILTAWKGRDFQGNAPTPTGLALRLITPLSLNNLREDVADPETEEWFANFLFSLHGFNARTYDK